MSQDTSFYHDLYPRGVRKLLALGVIFCTTLLPATYAWQHEPEQAPQPGFGPSFEPRFSRPGGMRGSQWDRFDGTPSAKRSGLPIGRTVLAMFGGAVGLMIYYPRWGFKRYALLCGPLLGFGSMYVASWYLTGRTRVYRFEPVFAALIGAAPGVVLYALLARRKWYKLHSSIALAEIVDESEPRLPG